MTLDRWTGGGSDSFEHATDGEDHDAVSMICATNSRSYRSSGSRSEIYTPPVASPLGLALERCDSISTSSSSEGPLGTKSPTITAISSTGDTPSSLASDAMDLGHPVLASLLGPTPMGASLLLSDLSMSAIEHHPVPFGPLEISRAFSDDASRSVHEGPWLDASRSVHEEPWFAVSNDEEYLSLGPYLDGPSPWKYSVMDIIEGLGLIRPTSEQRSVKLQSKLDEHIEVWFRESASVTLSIGFDIPLICRDIHKATLHADHRQQTAQYIMEGQLAIPHIQQVTTAMVYAGPTAQLDRWCNEWVKNLVDEDNALGFFTFAFQDNVIQYEFAEMAARYRPTDASHAEIVNRARRYAAGAYIVSRVLQPVAENSCDRIQSGVSAAVSDMHRASAHLLSDQLKNVLASQLEHLEQWLVDRFYELVSGKDCRNWATALCVLITKGLALEVQQSLRQLAAHANGDPDLLRQADKACINSETGFEIMVEIFFRHFGANGLGELAFNPLTGPDAYGLRQELDHPSRDFAENFLRLLSRKNGDRLDRTVGRWAAGSTVEGWPGPEEVICSDARKYPSYNSMRLVSGVVARFSSRYFEVQTLAARLVTG